MNPNTVTSSGIRKLYPSGLLLIALFLFGGKFLNPINAQCALACKGKVNISLGDNCSAKITPQLVLTGGQNCPDARFRVDVLDYNMKKIPGSPYVNYQHIRMDVIAMVFDSNSKNSCWTKLYVEDKTGPHIDCRNDTLYCNDTLAYTPPHFFDYCYDSATIHLLDIQPILFNCDPVFMKMLIRKWMAVDEIGNKSYCTDTIWLKRVPVDDVEYPKDAIHSNGCFIECNSEYLKDAKGNPDPSVTGAPSIHNHSLWPDFNQYCNVGTSYEDVVVVKTECKIKIIRMWRIVEWWCNTINVRTHPQTIEIIDTKGPEVHCPYDMTVSTSGYSNCLANFRMPKLEAHDACQPDDSLHYEIFDEYGLLLSKENGGQITLDVGNHTIHYLAIDKCYNSSSCDVHIKVEDKTPPVPICQQFTVVSLSRDSVTEVDAKTFDDGSHDECHIDSFLVRRMDFGVICGKAEFEFKPTVKFCCLDAGRTIRVIMRVKDDSGNYNDCMVQVEVQDKTPPSISCPHNVSIECTDHIDTSTFKKFGEATFYDNCNANMTEYIDPHVNQCGLGYYARNFTVRDRQGRSDTCTQRIYVYDKDPFDSTDIIWPLDTTIYSCGLELDPAQLGIYHGYPRYLKNDCSLIGVDHHDHIFNFVGANGDVCFKMLRKWKVIDWCQSYYDQDSNFVGVIWEHEQVIKVHNNVAPTIVGRCDSVRVCLPADNCDDQLVTLSKLAHDDCTPDSLMTAGYTLDINNNGLFDDYHIVNGNIDTFNQRLPLGEHRLIWQFEDKCGNQKTCTQIINVINCKIPTAYCLTGIAVNLQGIDIDSNGTPDRGIIRIWASDLDKGSSQICGNPVVVSFSKDTNDIFRDYTCDSVGMRNVTIWVTDRITGLQDVCRSVVVVQDNNNVCRRGRLTSMVAGALLAPDDKPLENVRVQIEQAGNIIHDAEFSGQFNYDNMNNGLDYSIKAIKDRDYSEGVTTLDIVQIQKHILGQSTLNSDWKLIAADINDDHKITAADMSGMRKLILGLDTKYKNNMSWRFVQRNYKFPNPDDPWQEVLPERYDILGLPGDMMYLDFKGVKIGDVSQTVWGGLKGTESRSAKPLELYAIPQVEENKIQIVSNQEMNLSGMQFTLRFDPTLFNILQIKSGILPIQSSNIGWKYVDKGILLVSWNVENNIDLKQGDPLFYIETDKDNITDQMLHSLSITSDVLTTEAYDANEIIHPVIMLARNKSNSDILFGNPIPNPFTVETKLNIDLPKASTVNYSLSSLDGIQVWTKTQNCNIGRNEITIRKRDIPMDGIYTLRVEVAGEMRTYKLIAMQP